MSLPDIIAAIRAAEAKATPGPWIVNAPSDIWHGMGPGGSIAKTLFDSDDDFIAKVRNHILALCDAAEELGQLKKDLAALDALFQKVLEGRDSARAERDALRAEVEAVRRYLSDPGGNPFHDGDSILEQVQAMHRQMQQERKALEAEVEALRKDAAEARKEAEIARQPRREFTRMAEEQMRKAREEIEALRQDKARLDWLEHYLSDDAKNLSQPTANDPTWQFGYNPGPAYQIDGGGDSLREAIDEAMP